jgi:hypothetical protein
MYFLKYCDIKCRDAHVCCIYCLEYSGCEVPIFCSYKATIQLHNEIRGTLDPKKTKDFDIYFEGKNKNLFINPNFNLLQWKIWINYFSLVFI